jgi:protocatechuate 3,4-dioxygenase beta subunit
MKHLFFLLCFITFLSFQPTLSAQESTKDSDYLTRHAIYDYDANTISNTDSIPDFESKQERFKITGTIYLSDGVTPAKDVILYIEQPDEKGNYEMKKQDGKRYVHHRAWVKTDADGRYTFYTFMPGNYHRRGEFKHIHPVVKEDGKQAYALDAFLFDSDVSLSNYCRKRLAKKGKDNVLTIEEKDQMFVATKDIVLEDVAEL